MELYKLELFICLAEKLSFTKAAEYKHITQASMSRQISALESEIGVMLVKRNSRNVELTPEGQEFYLHALGIVNNYNYALERVTHMDQNQHTVRIGFGPYEHALAQPVIEEFVKQYPNVRLACYQYDYSSLADYFRKGLIDIMFCINQCAERARCSQTIDLYDGNWLTLCSKDSELLNIKKLKLSHFNNQVFINLEASLSDIQLKEPVRVGFTPSYMVETNTLSSKISLTSAGVGISRVPQFLEHLIPDTVAILDCTFPSVRRFLCGYSETKTDSYPLKEFIEIVKEIYA